ncbi:MAG: hypothetical protein ACREJN_08850 [Nitrospiraceae bacterium]
MTITQIALSIIAILGAFSAIHGFFVKYVISPLLDTKLTAQTKELNISLVTTKEFETYKTQDQREHAELKEMIQKVEPRSNLRRNR